MGLEFENGIEDAVRKNIDSYFRCHFRDQTIGLISTNEFYESSKNKDIPEYLFFQTAERLARKILWEFGITKWPYIDNCCMNCMGIYVDVEVYDLVLIGTKDLRTSLSREV